MLGPQFSYIKSTTQPFDVEDASYDPQAVQSFNEEHLNRPLGEPTHTIFHEFGTASGPVGTAITKHHPRGTVLDSIHVNHDKRGSGEGTRILNHLIHTYGKLHPSGHYVDQRSLDWHNKNASKFVNDPEYDGNRIVEDEEGW